MISHYITASEQRKKLHARTRSGIVKSGRKIIVIESCSPNRQKALQALKTKSLLD